MIEHEWVCPCCGETQSGLLDSMAYQSPDEWLDKGWLARAFSHHSDDFCLIRKFGQTRSNYIRCIMSFSIKGEANEIMFGVWMSVSRKSLRVYEDGFKSGAYEKSHCFGYLSNNIFGFENSRGLHANIDFGTDNQRPKVFLDDCDHEIFEAQQNGLDLDYIERLTAAMSGHA